MFKVSALSDYTNQSTLETSVGGSIKCNNLDYKKSPSDKNATEDISIETPGKKNYSSSFILFSMKKA